MRKIALLAMIVVFAPQADATGQQTPPDVLNARRLQFQQRYRQRLAEIVDGYARLARWAHQRGLEQHVKELLAELKTMIPATAQLQQLQNQLSSPHTGPAWPAALAERQFNQKLSALRGRELRALAELADRAGSAGLTAEQLDCYGRMLHLAGADERLLSLLQKGWEQLIRAGRITQARRLLRKVLKVKSDYAPARQAMRRTAEMRDRLTPELSDAVQAAMREPLQQSLGTHPMRYWLILPKQYDFRRRWPLVISVNGAQAMYLSEARSWMGQRGRGYIIAVPVTISNTTAAKIRQHYPQLGGTMLRESTAGHIARLRFDTEGVMEMIDELVSRFGARRDELFMTGLSGGGDLCYYWIFHYNDKLAAAAPRNPNFHPQLYQLNKLPRTDPRRKDFPVHIFTAGDDEYKYAINGRPGLAFQTRLALRTLKQYGFENIAHTEVPGVTHLQSWKYYNEILDFFDSVRKVPKKRAERR